MRQAGQELSSGDLLRRYRMNAELTPEQLAERAGLSRRGFADWNGEHGGHRMRRQTGWTDRGCG
jgi:DNA-binding XRE family transcriptional regulator